MATNWLTTAPNPKSPATGHDAGQRGWKLHAVECGTSDSLKAVRFTRAACGLLPSHGWGLDAFVDDVCQRCTARLKKG